MSTILILIIHWSYDTMAGLFDLPPDVLALVVASRALSARDLCALSRVCRRMRLACGGKDRGQEGRTEQGEEAFQALAAPRWRELVAEDFLGVALRVVRPADSKDLSSSSGSGSFPLSPPPSETGGSAALSPPPRSSADPPVVFELVRGGAASSASSPLHSPSVSFSSTTGSSTLSALVAWPLDRMGGASMRRQMGLRTHLLPARTWPSVAAVAEHLERIQDLGGIHSSDVGEEEEGEVEASVVVHDNPGDSSASALLLAGAGSAAASSGNGNNGNNRPRGASGSRRRWISPVVARKFITLGVIEDLRRDGVDWKLAYREALEDAFMDAEPTFSDYRPARRRRLAELCATQLRPGDVLVAVERAPNPLERILTAAVRLFRRRSDVPVHALFQPAFALFAVAGGVTCSRLAWRARSELLASSRPGPAAAKFEVFAPNEPPRFSFYVGVAPRRRLRGEEYVSLLRKQHVGPDGFVHIVAEARLRDMMLPVLLGMGLGSLAIAAVRHRFGAR
jgi:F-box-like